MNPHQGLPERLEILRRGGAGIVCLATQHEKWLALDQDVFSDSLPVG
jgi:3,4-dihydroxy-2-butanone 4-phosphate synthase